MLKKINDLDSIFSLKNKTNKQNTLISVISAKCTAITKLYRAIKAIAQHWGKPHFPLLICYIFCQCEVFAKMYFLKVVLIFSLSTVDRKL